MSAIKVKKLKKYFGKTKAVDDISFEVGKGEVFGFLGPNGAGKTTTIRCMMDFLRPTSGKIEILDQDAQKDSVALKSKIGYLSADNRLYENWSGQTHIDFIQAIRGKSKDATSLARNLELNLTTRARNLSSGNKQKLSLVLALMARPKILILDEPTRGLDPLLQNSIYQILEDRRRAGVTIFMSSHNLPEVERICNRVAIIKEGKLVATESIDQLKEKKLYTIDVHFVQKFDPQDFQGAGIEILDQYDNHLRLSAKGDINQIIKKLAGYQLRDLEISRASLEEIFLEFYRRK